MHSFRSFKYYVAKHLKGSDSALVALLSEKFIKKEVGCFIEAPPASVCPKGFADSSNNVTFIFIRTGSENAASKIYLNAMEQLQPQIVQFMKDNGIDKVGTMCGYIDKFGAWCIRFTIIGEKDRATAEKLRNQFQGREAGVSL